MAGDVVSLGIRLTDDAWLNFNEACLRAGLIIRSALEAAVELVSLFTRSPERRLATVPHLTGPVLEQVVVAAWEAAERIERRHRSARESRHKISIRTDAASVGVLRDALEARRISINAALASVFTPWGSGWGDAAAYQLRLDLWEWAAEKARARDYLRRRGTRGTALQRASQFAVARLSPAN